MVPEVQVVFSELRVLWNESEALVTHLAGSQR